MLIRWRRLSSKRDLAVYRDQVSVMTQQLNHDPLGVTRFDVRGEDVLLGTLAGVVSAEVAGPRQVFAVEHQGTLEELTAGLKERELSLEDLVNDGSGWVPLRHWVPLADEVARLEHAETWARRLRVTAVVGALCCGLLLLFALA